MPAPRILRDLIRDSSLRVTPEGVELDRTFAVADVPIANRSLPSSNILLAALTAVGIPRYGDLHPDSLTYGYNLQAKGFSVKPLGGCDNAMVVVTYFAQGAASGTGIVLRNYSSGVAWEQQDTDINGNPITVIYKVHEGDPGTAPPGGSEILKAGATVSGPFPFKRILITRFFGAGAFSSAVWIDPFIGNKNHGTWITENVPDGNGLVMSVDANTSDGQNYKVVWDVMCRDEGWDAYAAYVLPTGQRPYNAFNGYLGSGVTNGFTKVVVTDIADLNLIC